MKLKKKTAALFAASLMIMTLASGCGQTKIGYIDSDRVVKEAPQLKTMMDEGNQKLLEAQKEVEALMQNTDGKSEEELAKAAQDAQRKLMGLNQQYATRLQQTIENALADIAKEKELDTVVDNFEQQKTVIQGGIDVTEDVIQKLQ